MTLLLIFQSSDSFGDPDPDPEGWLLERSSHLLLDRENALMVQKSSSVDMTKTS